MNCGIVQFLFQNSLSLKLNCVRDFGNFDFGLICRIQELQFYVGVLEVSILGD